MSDSSFPKIQLNEPADLDYVFDAVGSHAKKNLAKALISEAEQDDEAMRAAQKSVDLWIQVAKKRIEPNLLANGLALSEISSHKTPVAPFDAALSERVQSLASQAETLTAQVVAARKAVPNRRAAAIEARARAVDAMAVAEEERRRAVEREWSERSVEEMRLKLDRPEEVHKTLTSAVNEIDALQLAMLEQNTEAKDHMRLIKRLRTN